MAGVYESQPRHYSARSRSLSLATIHEVERPPLSPPPQILRRSNTSQHIQPPPHYRPARLPESHELSFDSTRSNTSRYRAPLDAGLQPPLIPYGTKPVLNQDAVSESDASCDSYEYVAKKCLESSPSIKSAGPDAHQEVTDQTGLGIYTPEEQLVLQRADSIRRRHGTPRPDDRGRQTQDDAYTGTKFRQKSTDAQIRRRSTAPELGTNVLRARALPTKELPSRPHSDTWKADKYVTKQYHNLDLRVPTSKVTLSACSSNGQGGESPILGFSITERIRESENHITKSVGQRLQDSTLKSRKTSCQTNEELDHRRASSKATCKVSAEINESDSTDQYPYEWYDDLSWTVDESSGIIPPHTQHGFKLSRGSKRNISHHHTTLTYLSERSLHGGSRHGVDRDRMEAEGRAKWDQVEAAWEATKAAGNSPIHDFMPALSGKEEKSKGEKKEKQARRVNSQPTLKDEDVPPRSSSSGKTSQDSKTVWTSEPILNSQNPYSEAAGLHRRNTTGSSSQTRQNSSPTRHHKKALDIHLLPPTNQPT
jgi:hypothetical protein